MSRWKYVMHGDPEVGDTLRTDDIWVFGLNRDTDRMEVKYGWFEIFSLEELHTFAYGAHDGTAIIVKQWTENAPDDGAEGPPPPPVDPTL